MPLVVWKLDRWDEFWGSSRPAADQVPARRLIWQQPVAKLAHRGWISILFFFKLIDSVSQILDRRHLALKRVR